MVQEKILPENEDEVKAEDMPDTSGGSTAPPKKQH